MAHVGFIEGSHEIFRGDLHVTLRGHKRRNGSSVQLRYDENVQSCLNEGDAMKRFRLSTVMLLVIIVALGVALVVQEQRARRREAALLAQLHPVEHTRVAPFSGIITKNKIITFIEPTTDIRKVLEELTIGRDKKEEGK
jgi:hypothetical protein